MRPASIETLRQIAAERQAQRLRYEAGPRRGVLCDVMTASAVLAVHDALTSDELRAKVARLVAAHPAGLVKVASVLWARPVA